MRARWVLVALVVALLAVPFWACAEDGGGIDPGLPDGLYAEGKARPIVIFPNHTFEKNPERGTVYNLTLSVENHLSNKFTFILTLEIYSLGEYAKETPLYPYEENYPYFIGQPVGSFTNISSFEIPQSEMKDLSVPLAVWNDNPLGYYRVRMKLEWSDESAASRGHFSDHDWQTSLKNISKKQNPIDHDYLLDEGGFTVVKPGHILIKTPNLVPDLGDFTTPVIQPGESGTYNFTVTNRYAGDMVNITLIVEIYMWATIEEAKELGKV